MTSIDGIDVEVIRCGAGRPLVLLHGFQQIDPDAQFLKLLSQKAEIMAPSLPGFGRSARPKDFETIYDLVNFSSSSWIRFPFRRSP